MALLDNGTQINTIMPDFVENHSLDVEPLSDLVSGWVTFVGLGNTLTQLVGYVVIWVQVDGVQGYDEDQVENTIWNWSHQSATFSEKKLPIWHIKSQRMGCNPVIWTWKQSQSSCHLKLTLRCMPFLVWWATREGSSRGLHALHSHVMNTWLGKGPAGSQSGCCFWKMPWRLLKHWNRHLWQLLFWLLLTTLNHSSWRLMHPKRDLQWCYHRSR